ncbi:hypothetical protein [Hymenobacter sp.]|uniref:hypothetical protein n=1 Tax=Hymenobacter sp. TaxID=1898978 RepID=UPI00286B63E5|nr:hypothetical protein [Hymenobacter sp.]
MRPMLAVLFVVGGGLVGACSGTHEPLQDRAAPVVAVPLRSGAKVDVPGLLGLSIDEVSQRLGPRLPVPAGFVDPVVAPLVQRNAPLDSMVLFRHQGLALVASYDHRTRRVSDLLLLGSNESELMSRGQLQIGAAKYLVLPVFQERHPTRLLGLRVVGTALNQ